MQRRSNQSDPVLPVVSVLYPNRPPPCPKRSCPSTTMPDRKLETDMYPESNQTPNRVYMSCLSYTPSSFKK